MVPTKLTFLFAVLALVGRAAPVGAQFVVDNSNLPSGSNNNSTTENVDFGDVDLDGDWDCAMADGGDDGNDQNRIWINQGNLQGGSVGNFQDETAARFPSVLDDSRDIEFADIDNDSDLDIYISNTAQITNQGNRWWVNLGAKQGGTMGFYNDETSTRWVGLGGAGSSIAPSQVLPLNTFIDWSCDCDFGDLDNDGDLDLVHSSYGGSFGGSVPTRLFLNDGDGHFSEFNPSGFQLTGPTISNGNPGLWCEGTQQADTTNSTGVNCDIASSALDIDVADIDGDFDLDILHGARNEAPRMFANRLDSSSLAPANGGALLFRDVTGAAFAPGYFAGTFGHYEQEMGDMDGDGDVDLYGLNWQTNFGFDDVVMENIGGFFSNQVVLGGSSDDDNEGDFIDYDNDGDLDLWVANFSGGDKLYRNNNNGGSSFSYTQVSAPFFSAVSLDADVCDTDNDGDYDVLVAEDNFQANTFCRNTTGVVDTHAPYIPAVEKLTNRPAEQAGAPIRAQVYDNAPYYITWYNPTEIQVTVDGCDLPAIPARSSAGQIFRAVMPGNLVGNVSYKWSSHDEYGNTGTSASSAYISSYGGPSFATTYGTGTNGSLGEPTISAISVPYVDSTLYLSTGNSAPGTPVLIYVTGSALPVPFQLGNILLANVGGPIFLSEAAVSNANGCATVAIPIPDSVSAGLQIFAQGFALGGVVDLLASTKGLQVTLQ